MNAQELYVKKETNDRNSLHTFHFNPAQVWFCEKCKLVYANQMLAEQCCGIKKCKCGGDCEKYYYECPDCIQKTRDRIELEKFNKAQKLDIKNYEGYLLSGEYASDDFAGYFDDYFENLELDCPKCGGKTEPKDCPDIKEYNHLKCSECGWTSQCYEIIDEIYYLFAPEYIWATDFTPVRINIDIILENISENHHESVSDYMKGIKELEIAIDKWNKLNESCGTYQESNKLALINIKDFVKELYNK